jgi:A nuclease of the HNH/ENDO VII superfamily with conserved WHH
MGSKRYPPPPTRFPAPSGQLKRHAVPPPALAPMRAPPPRPGSAAGAVQRTEMKLRSHDKKAPSSDTTSVPKGYVSIAEFNKGDNKYGKYKGGLEGRSDTDIFVCVYKEKVFLWWQKPLHQLYLVYNDSATEDIKDCKQVKDQNDHIWHHTGYPQDSEQAGYMQLVPAVEHKAIHHYGGASIAGNRS